MRELVYFCKCFYIVLEITMSRIIKNIIRCVVVGFLLLAISGLTITIHHEHQIGDILAEHGHSHTDEHAVKTSASTYHEIHLVKLVSGDSFDGSQKIDFKSPLVKIFAVPLDPLELAHSYHPTSSSNLDISNTGPPSVDRYVLICSFLI